jgi:hypothetical protein
MTSYTLRPLPDVPDTTLASQPPLIRTLLLSRGITTDEEAERFLTPGWERDTHDPFLLKDMQKVCERITRAVNDNETIVIWSDYDMDGIPGAVVLWDFFRAIGYSNVLHHTPHRNKDGFGLNKDGLDDLVALGAKVVITVDCGIGDVELVAYGTSLGFDRHRPPYPRGEVATCIRNHQPQTKRVHVPRAHALWCGCRLQVGAGHALLSS